MANGCRKSHARVREVGSFSRVHSDTLSHCAELSKEWVTKLPPNLNRRPAPHDQTYEEKN